MSKIPAINEIDANSPSQESTEVVVKATTVTPDINEIQEFIRLLTMDYLNLQLIGGITHINFLKLNLIKILFLVLIMVLLVVVIVKVLIL